jgi:TrmH family RNA methyltransferase
VSGPITSRSNPRIKSLVRLRNRRERDRTGHFVIEGFRELRRAVEAGLELETVYSCPSLYLGENEPALVESAAGLGAEVIEVSPGPFEKASYRDRPEGVMAVARQFDTSLARLRLADSPLVLVAEAIEKPGNLGSMLRTAEAAGADAVIVADPTTDPFNPNVVRASLGTLFTVDLAVATTIETIEFLRQARIEILAASPDARTSLFDAHLRGPVALVVGSEQLGLSAEWTEAGTGVSIPMPGSMDSLNAATAAGVLLFEAVRQRL